MSKIALVSATVVGFFLLLLAFPDKAFGSEDKPWVCHPVEGAGETGYGWNLIDPDKSSSHIDEATGAGKHTRKDGRTDVYASLVGDSWVCPGAPTVEPSVSVSITETVTTSVTVSVTPTTSEPQTSIPVTTEVCTSVPAISPSTTKTPVFASDPPPLPPALHTPTPVRHTEPVLANTGAKVFWLAIIGVGLIGAGLAATRKSKKGKYV